MASGGTRSACGFLFLLVLGIGCGGSWHFAISSAPCRLIKRIARTGNRDEEAIESGAFGELEISKPDRGGDMGLVIVGALALYLLISIVVVIGAIKYAKQNGKSAKRWGWSAALVMYLIPFWDWIPTVVVHQYYCKTESGFWIYKTLDQWKKENPGVMLTLNGTTSIRKTENGYQETHQINQRIHWVIALQSAMMVLQVAKREEVIVDTENDKVLARFVDFSRGNQRSTGTFKFWLVSGGCNGDEIHRIRMGGVIDEINAEAMGGGK